MSNQIDQRRRKLIRAMVALAYTVPALAAANTARSQAGTAEASATSFAPLKRIEAGVATAAGAASFELLAQPGHVLLLRHANAPGVGDPAGMKLSDCATQRNLDDVGRKQARELGRELRAAGVTNARVYTSELCRCRETAQLLDVGPVQTLPALNSTIGRPEQERATQIEALRAFLAKLPRDGGPVVLVTHQVIVTALTDNYPASGGGSILRLRPNGEFERVSEVSAEI